MDMLAYDKLCRITAATQSMARQVGSMVPVASYNHVVELYNELSRRYEDLRADRDRCAANEAGMTANRDDWRDYARSMKARALKAEARVAELEKARRVESKGRVPE